MKLNRSIGLCGAVLTVLALTACGAASPDSSDAGEGSAETVTLKVGVSPTISGTGFHAAVEGGYFEEEGLKIETTTMQSGSQAIPLLLNGEVQFSVVDVPGTAVAVEKRLPIRLVAGVTHTADDRESTDAILVTPDSDIERARDLEGKTVAVSSLVSTPALYLLAAVSADGGDRDAVNLVEVPQASTTDAVLDGTVDAAILFEPFAAQARDAGLEVLTHPGRDAAAGAMQAAYAATEEYLDGNSEIAARFVAAIERGNADIEESVNGDGEFLRDLVRRTTEIDPAAIDAMILPVYKSGPIDTDAIDVMLALLFEAGYIETELGSSDLVWNNG